MLVLISHRSCRVGDSFTKVSLKENSTSRWVRCPSRRTYCRYGNHTPGWRSVSENDSAFPGVRDVLAPTGPFMGECLRYLPLDRHRLYSDCLGCIASKMCPSQVRRLQAPFLVGSGTSLRVGRIGHHITNAARGHRSPPVSLCWHQFGSLTFCLCSWGQLYRDEGLTGVISTQLCWLCLAACNSRPRTLPSVEVGFPQGSGLCPALEASQCLVTWSGCFLRSCSSMQ